MSENILSTCASCGYYWITGTSGDHSCARVLQESLAQMTIELQATQLHLMSEETDRKIWEQDCKKAESELQAVKAELKEYDVRTKTCEERACALLNKISAERDNFRKVLEGQGFENLDSMAKETRDTTQIGEVAKQRTLDIIAERDEALKTIETQKKLWSIDLEKMEKFKKELLEHKHSVKQTTYAFAVRKAEEYLADLQAAREKATQLEEMYSELYEHHKSKRTEAEADIDYYRATIASQAEEIESLKQTIASMYEQSDLGFPAYKAEIENLKENKANWAKKAFVYAKEVCDLQAKLQSCSEENANIHYELVNRIAELSEATAKLSHYETATSVEGVVQFAEQLQKTIINVDDQTLPYDLIGKRVKAIVMETINKGE